MDEKQLNALKKTDLSPFIRMADLMTPRILGAFLPKLDEKQKAAFDKALPSGGQKRIYVHLSGTPTPPIVIQIAQPPKMSIMSENEVKAQGIKGLKLTTDDLQFLSERKIGKILWRLKGQAGTLLSLSGMALPFIQLGPREIKDLQDKVKTHFKPALELLPH